MRIEISHRCSCRSGFTRRHFLGALGALATAGTATSAAPSSGERCVDVHHHISPPEWVAALKKSQLDTPPVNNWTVQRSLDDMDKAGVATSVTSPTLPAVSFLPPGDAAAIARASNEYARRLADDHPGRFGMFVMLPMPHVDETLKEIAYGLDILKADGVAFMTSYGDKFLGDPAFASVMDELHRRKVTAYTHPNEPACCRNLATGVPSIIIEYGTDTTRTIASLIFSGTATRCKDINFIFSHGGGTLSALTERFTVQVVAFPQYKDRGFTGEGVMKLLQGFYYDTAQCSNPIAMASLTKFIPTSNIVFGTDYPYRTAEEHVKGLAGVFGPADLAKIERANAMRLMPRLPA